MTAHHSTKGRNEASWNKRLKRTPRRNKADELAAGISAEQPSDLRCLLEVNGLEHRSRLYSPRVKPEGKLGGHEASSWAQIQ